MFVDACQLLLFTLTVKCNMGRRLFLLEMQCKSISNDSPVHWNSHSLLIKIPCAQQVCAGKVGSIKPPGGLKEEIL